MAEEKPEKPQEPQAAPPQAAAPIVVKQPAPPLPEPKLRIGKERLLTRTRYWPTEKWRDPWSDPGYRLAALLLAGILIGPLIFGAAVGELSVWAERLFRILSEAANALGIPGLLLVGTWDLAKVVIILGIVLVNALFLVWWERKVSAHMQSRFGPMRVGGWHGWAQTIADALKLFLKEDIIPAAADSWVHRAAPVIAFVPALICFAPVMFGDGLAAAPIDTGVLYILAVAGVSVIGIVMAGWGSGNKYSLLGGLRSAAQLVSYELPRTFSVVPVILLSGSLSLTVITQAQAGYWGGIIPRWFIFYPVAGQLAFLIFLLASVAETNRVPFDIPEAESELVAGFHTEYSGMKWALFFLTEYAYVLLSCCLAATFFLGGGAAPLSLLAFIPSWIWFLAKVMFLIFCFMWFRWTFPRLRVDRLMDFSWKFLLPWSFANIAFASLYLLI